MGSDIPGVLRVLADAQGGVVTSTQALETGLSKGTLTWQLRTGRWQQLHQGVYALFTGEPSRQALLWAAVLRVGRGAVLSHHTAAELARLIDQPSDSLHVTVPESRRVRPASGIVVHRSSHTRGIREPGLVPPRTRIEHTVLDLVGQVTTFDEACDWVTRACGRRLTTQERLRTALLARDQLRWREALAPLLADEANGLHSVLEVRYHRDVEQAHRLPPAARQLRVVRGQRTQYRDVAYREYLVVVELDGRLAHPAEARWRDIHRDNAAAAEGSVTLRYSWTDVTAHPCRTADEVARVLTRRGWSGSPKPCSPGCPVLTTG